MQGPGGIMKGNYDARNLSQEQRQWLFSQFGHQGEAPVGYGGEIVAGSPEDIQRKMDAKAAQDKIDTQNRFNQAKGDITDFNTRFSTGVPNIINDTSAKYGLGMLLGQANDIGTRVSQLQTNSNRQGAGGYANAGQVDAAVTGKYLPAYQNAVSNLQRGTSLAQNEEQTLLQPYLTEASLLNDRLAREATGYSQEQQRELDALVAQYKAGIDLTTAQMKNMTDLALAESDYRKAVETAKINNQNNNQNRYIAIGDGTQLYDTQTGQIVAENVKNFKASGTGETFS